MGFSTKVYQHLLLYFADFARLCLWLLLLVAIFGALEKIFALHKQRLFRGGFFRDVAYYFVSGFSASRLLILPMSAIAWGVHQVVPTGLQTWTGALPLAIRIAASMIVGEIGFYWGHRWSHEIPFLWRFHAVHHTAEEMDWLVSSRSHPVDIVFTRLCGFIPMYVLGLSRPLAGSVDAVPVVVMLIGTVWGFFIHANLKWRFGPLEWLIATPGFHHWHHTYEEPLNRNFAPMLPWVDWVFRTHYAPKGEWPARYGTQTAVPSNFVGQLLNPLVPASREMDGETQPVLSETAAPPFETSAPLLK
jgi:sterol desaturase/sphingolipid hydroxylase (fatty acid hydroxylase superfamily)